MKRFIALVLSLVMALSLCVPAFGAGEADALAEAIADGATEITLAAGNYKMPSSSTTASIKISGPKDAVIDMTMGAYLDSATLSFEGVTIKTGTGYANGNGSDYAALYSTNVTYTNCTFEGPMRVGRDGAKFINCTFTELGNDYVWTYGNDVTFEGCTFNTNGKAILIYSDGGNEISQVSVTGCTFNATTSAKAGAIANQNCAAIEVHNYGNGVNLTTSGNTIDTDFSGEWRIKTYEAGKPGITANGTEFTTIALDGNKMTIDGNKNVTVLPPVAKIGNVNYYSLAEAVADAQNGDTIKLLTDITGDVTVTQKEGVKFTIDGANKTFNGTIIVDGKSARYATAGVTIQKVNFNATTLSNDAYINLGKGDNNTRYTNNVTVKDCTFSYSGSGDVVAVKSYTGGDWNLTIEGCTVNSGMHSLLQAANVEKGLKIADCKVYSKNGINLNNTPALEMSGCTFETQGYAVRVGVNGSVNVDEKAFNITNSTLKSAGDDGDAVIIFRDNAKNATMTITDTTLTGTTTFAGNTNVTDIYVDGALVGGVAEVVGGDQYKSLAEAVAAAPAGGTVKLLADCDETVIVNKALTFDFNGYNFTGFIQPGDGYTYMDGVVKKAVASGTTSTGTVTSGTVTPVKAKMYRLATAGTSMTELNIKVEKIEKTTVTGKLVNDVPAYVPNIYKINDNAYYVEVAKADATFALKNNGAYVYLAPATGCADANAVITKFATAVVLDQYIAAAEDVECGDAIKGTKGAAIYMSGNDAYYADGSDWAYFKGEFVKYNAKAKVDFQPHKWDAKSIIVKSTDVKGTKVPVTIECEKCEKTFSIVPSAKFDNTWVKGVNYTTDNAVDKYNTAAVKYYIVLNDSTYTGGTYVPSTDKVVQSADTFDAGIAMYVGMSVLAATGSAVVIGKKKD